jgi:hypothetical protein
MTYDEKKDILIDNIDLLSDIIESKSMTENEVNEILDLYRLNITRFLILTKDE